MNLDELRKRIDALDTEILRCLNERARCALEIGDIKRANNAVYYVPERERAVYDKLLRENQGPLTEAAIRPSTARSSAPSALLKPVDVAFLGPRYLQPQGRTAHLRHATYHPVAAVDAFSPRLSGSASIRGRARRNLHGRRRHDTLGRFLTSDVKIVNGSCCTSSRTCCPIRPGQGHEGVFEIKAVVSAATGSRRTTTRAGGDVERPGPRGSPPPNQRASASDLAASQPQHPGPRHRRRFGEFHPLLCHWAATGQTDRERQDLDPLLYQGPAGGAVRVADAASGR